MIKATEKFIGMRRPYGDYEHEWLVEADINKTSDQVLAWCKENLLDGRNIPSYREHSVNYRKTGDLGSYFDGYYELRMLMNQNEPNVKLYRFCHIVPNCD